MKQSITKLIRGAITIGAASFSAHTFGATGFIIMGDSGTGKPEQYRVAAAMKEVCQTALCDFALGLGDNIYESGVRSAVDQQFSAKFEQPFAGLDIPFFMVQGNHDNTLLIPGDGGFNQKGFYEVEYTKHSQRWKMPSRYYAFESPEGNALFIGYDSNPQNAYLPPILSPYWWPNGTYVKQQKAWLIETVSESDALWKFAFAHHPYMTNGDHGRDFLVQGKQPYNSFVKQSLCGKVDFILTGHEHALEILQAHEDICGNTIHVVSGAAAKNNGERTRNVYQEIWQSYENKWGFMHGLIDGNEFTLTSYVVDKTGAIEKSFSRIFHK